MAKSERKAVGQHLVAVRGDRVGANKWNVRAHGSDSRTMGVVGFDTWVDEYMLDPTGFRPKYTARTLRDIAAFIEGLNAELRPPAEAPRPVLARVPCRHGDCDGTLELQQESEGTLRLEGTCPSCGQADSYEVTVSE